MPFPSIGGFYSFKGGQSYWGYTEKYDVDAFLRTDIKAPDKEEVTAKMRGDFDLAISSELGAGTGAKFHWGDGSVWNGLREKDEDEYRVIDASSMFLWVDASCDKLGVARPDPMLGPKLPPKPWPPFAGIQDDDLQQNSTQKRTITNIAGFYKITLRRVEHDDNNPDGNLRKSEVVITHDLPSLNSAYGPDSHKDVLHIMRWNMKRMLDRINSWPHNEIAFEPDNYILVTFCDNTVKPYPITKWEELEAFTEEIFPLIRTSNDAKEFPAERPKLGLDLAKHLSPQYIEVNPVQCQQQDLSMAQRFAQLLFGEGSSEWY
ncbi:MAG TPA: hypothetical protein VLG38_05605, partial [Gammaproteobacteria bacterium]|nr:hypothetical protein [Gammaproteobacteria bacterium]